MNSSSNTTQNKPRQPLPKSIDKKQAAPSRNSSSQPPSPPKEVRKESTSTATPTDEAPHTPQSATSHILQQTSVDKTTTTILLGDGVIKGVDLSRSAPPNSSPQKLCVSDLTVTQLTHWLSGQTPAPAVRHATLHVGVNDCQATKTAEAISNGKWKDLLSQCRRVFPRASLRASAILPARGRHPLNAVIHPSNRNLRQVCDSMGAQFLDHTAVFIAASGAPRMALYKDAILPTKKGTARLAENLFQNQRDVGTSSKPPNTGQSRFLHSPSSSHIGSSSPTGYRSIRKHQYHVQSQSSPPLPLPTHPHYFEAFPPLPKRSSPSSRPPPPSSTTQAADMQGEERGWLPSPHMSRALHRPGAYPSLPPVFFPPYPRGFSPVPWNWSPFPPMPMPYSQF